MATNERILESIKGIVGSTPIKTDPEILSVHAVDGVVPWAVVFPENVEQVSEVVRLAFKENLALVPWGSGSKMEIGNPPSRLDLVISLTSLNRIIDMDTANLTVTVQSGTRFKDIQTALGIQKDRCYLPVENTVTKSDQQVCPDRDDKGCFIPMLPSHSNSATIGGIISANSAGPIRLLYGLPRDMILGVRYVSANGEIIKIGGKTVKNVAGYDMCKLMIGSYGSLGILCEITLRLLPLPERMGTFLSSFSTIGEASRFVDRIFETRMLPSAVELLNREAYSLFTPEEFSMSGNNSFAVAVGLEGSEETVERMAYEVKKLASESGANEISYLKEEAHKVFWYAYSNMVSKLPVRYPDLVSIKLNYPISRYLEVIELSKSLISENRLKHGFLTHAGSGVTRIHFLIQSGNKKVMDRVIAVTERLLDHCQNIDGNLIIEKAGAEVKQRVPVWGALREDIVVMKRIKEEMDPLNLLSPGRFVGGI